MDDAMPQASSDASEPSRGVHYTILLVEDEEMVRNLLCEVLQRENYNVLACSHPEEGIAMCRQHAPNIDLLLTDVVMPDMNGREMAARILEMLPSLQVVFMSGYTEHALTEGVPFNPHFEYLQKPFTLHALTQKVADVLQRVPR